MKLERGAKYFVIGFSAISLFFLVMGFVLSNSAKPLDYGIREGLVDSHSPFSNSLLMVFTSAFNNFSFFFIVLIAFVLLGKQKLWKEGFLLGGSILVSYIVCSIFKLLVSRERPFGAMLDESGYSFPSGHALKVTLFMLLFIFLYTETIPSFIGRKFLITFGWITIFLVCLSRLYFSVHWFTDVLGGFLLGLSAFCFSAWFRIRFEKLF